MYDCVRVHKKLSIYIIASAARRREASFTGKVCEIRKLRPIAHWVYGFLASVARNSNSMFLSDQQFLVYMVTHHIPLQQESARYN